MKNPLRFLIDLVGPNAAALPPTPMAPVPGSYFNFGSRSHYAHHAKKVVNPETAKKIATAYRCGNIISDDIATMPFQMFRRIGRNAEQVAPDAFLRNLAYLLEVKPNRWMVPFIFKKTIILWLLYWGNAYIWQPSGPYRELFILDADRTNPEYDPDGDLWYRTLFPNGTIGLLPAAEVTHLMINSTDGLTGRSVLEYAKETFGEQLGAYETKQKIGGRGLYPAAVLWVKGKYNQLAREKIRESYWEAIDSGGAAVMDEDVVQKVETVTLKPTDAQFLEGIDATDTDICNFFGVPLYMLNKGKQSYESNDQQDLHYLKSTLNPFLVQWEQVARIQWVRLEEQAYTYWRFNRNALLWMDAKTRAQVNKDKILSGQMELNESREIEDMPTHPFGDVLLIPGNYAVMDRSGNITPVSTGTSIYANPG